ncbi:MAG: hypothetical protein IJC46_04735 [Clostridia bacterium]|nr:hypothetical protein [Clostridia bacterium]
MKRIEELRNRVLAGPLFGEEFYYLFYKEYEQFPTLPEQERYAKAFYSAFFNLPPQIAEGELIVGGRNHPMPPQDQQQWDSVYRPIALARSTKAGGGTDSHMAIDYELLLSVGINGIIASITNRLKTCTQEQAAFYQCCIRCLEAVVVHSEHYADAALKMSQETTDPIRRRELQTIAEICRKVPAEPAETFYEAVQSVHFISYCLSINPFRVHRYQQFQLGHPDRYLLAFYKKDIQHGTITKEYAQLLLDCLGIQINMRIPHGLSCGYMVGGRDENGNIVANELTEMCMQVIDDIRLVYPSVGLCYTAGMPEKYLKKAVSLLMKGHSHPAIFNDDVITEGLIDYGVPPAQAHHYIHSTCVEITPIAASNVWVSSPFNNLAQLLLDIMDQEYATFEDLLNRYFEQLDTQIKTNFELQQQQRSVRKENSINPLLSCFVNDCLKRGLDMEQGGALYNWVMPSFVGMANLVDAIYAIKSLVFEEKRLSLTEFKAILDQNYEGHEPLRQHIRNQLPKYGNDIDEIDRYFSIFTEHIAEECSKYHGMFSNANLIPSVFCWVKHEQFGRKTAATPDGRKAGFPLGDGSGPCQGRELNGPTASVLSSTKWSHKKFIGGVAVNLKFTKTTLGENSSDVMLSIIKTYLERGGFELQINVVDNETLRAAQSRPEEYRDLIVRIGGYSDYFVKLSPEMQAEVLQRTAHSV